MTYQPVHPGPTVLRFPPVRWATAVILPFVCIIGGLMLGREWRPAGEVLGMLLGLVGCPVLSSIYLYRVLGAAPGWVFALIPLGISGTFTGSLILMNNEWSDPRRPGHSGQLAVTATYWIVWAVLLGLLAVSVILAVINGERWMQRNRYLLPRNKFEAYVRSRGTWAHIWLPS